MTTLSYYGNASADGVRDTTILPEVFFVNHHAMGQLTHIIIDDGGSFQSNLLPSALPWTLLPAAPATNDALYFGIESSLPDSGPFGNLIFDIGTVGTYTGAATLVWEYWNGAWVTLTVQDNTKDDGTKSFMGAYAGSVMWGRPSDWAETAVDSITGYWVRARVSLGGGTVSQVPIQVNRRIYSAIWPYFEVQASDLLGDLAAPINLDYKPSHNFNAVPTGKPPAVLIGGVRRLSRGPDFTPFINLSDTQNHPGITVTADDAAFADNPVSATGRTLDFTFASPADEDVPKVMGHVDMDGALSSQYRGRFHMFLRMEYTRNVSETDMEFWLDVRNGLNLGYPLLFHKEINADFALNYSGLDVYNLVDFGTISIPLSHASTIDAGLLFTVYCRAPASASIDGSIVKMHDIILMPVDELAFESGAASTSAGQRLSIDTITPTVNILKLVGASPKIPARGQLFYFNRDRWLVNWTLQANDLLSLPPDTRLRVWHLMHAPSGSASSSGIYEVGEIGWLLNPKMSASQAYFSLRGDR